ncbi:MAG TPA: GDSL-type esterase/lipase family protein [Candidatus Binatia bacterium]|nr:GDSL-type esterase/lipase family protein [Candidatus Binatia bacterium]
MLLALLLLEAALRVGAVYVALTRRVPGIATGRGRQIVCLGDSNTYGLHVRGEDAYPAVLERELNEHGAAGVRVLNLGIPGNNSSRIRNALPAVLAAHHPDLLTLMVGVNDFWTAPEPIDAAGHRSGPTSFLWRWSRVYRLAFVIWRATQTPADGPGPLGELPSPRGPGPKPADARFGWTVQEGGVADWDRGLRDNLTAIVAEARAAGVPVVLVTYPSDGPIYAGVNQMLRAAAVELGTPLVDVTAVVTPRCWGSYCRDLLFRDQHPTAKGHALAGRTLTEALVAGPSPILRPASE